MKKTIIYFLIFLIIIFVVPAICTKTSIKTVSAEVEETEEEETTEKYDYAEYSTIKLYHSDTKEVEELEFDEYLYGVVSAEMPASYEEEALKAQAIVARTYTLYQIINSKNKHEGADICDDYNCCQAWISKEDRMEKWSEDEKESNWNKIVTAVDSTSGLIITYDGEPINALFHSNSGGTTESVSSIWGEKDLPYLQSVETSGEDNYSQYSSELSLSKNDLEEKLKSKYSDLEIDWNDDDCIKIVEYTSSGRIKTIKFGNTEIAGTEARSLLGLKSTNFTFTIDGDNIIFSVIGYGHGVGMSQTGADSMAKNRKFL